MGGTQLGTASHLLVVSSCRKFENTRLAWQAQTWPQRLPDQIGYLAMTGAGDGRIDSGGILRLNVADGYCDLLDKTQALFDWFLAERDEPWLVKCDDDVWLSPQALELIAANQHVYAGAYGQLYAGGPLYVLHRDVVKKLAVLRDYAEDDCPPEDVAVGAAAKDANIQLNTLGFNEAFWYHHEKHQLVGEHNYDMVFCFSRQNHQQVMAYSEANYRPPTIA